MSTSNTVVDTATTQSQIDSYLNTLSQKYLANDAYIVSGTNSGIVSASVIALAPYGNLTNRYYPTVAGEPNEGDNLKTRDQLGGYFVPSNLGASLYLTKNITYSINTDQIKNGEVYHYINPSRFNKGRGLTQTDQGNIVNHLVNINWIKSANTSEYFDGNMINADTYQKFIPYQSTFETRKSDSNGVVNARYDFEFWQGDKKQTWTESNSATKLTPEKYFDLASRVQGLVSTPGKELYSWNTDVFGNQYALYKTITNPRSLYDSTTATGLLWVKTIDNTINLAPSALNLIYNAYKNNTTVYSQLTSNNIINFEVFFDTLVIQLSSSVLYEKITFNYDKYIIEQSLQNFQALNIGYTNSNALSTQTLNSIYGTPNSGLTGTVTYYGGNWYNGNEKFITICTLLSTTLSGTSTSIINSSGLSSFIVPVLYRLDLNNPQERVRIYPTNDTNFTEYIYPLSSGPLSALIHSPRIEYIEAPVFCYNEDTKLYSTTFIAFSAAGPQVSLINYKINA